MQDFADIMGLPLAHDELQGVAQRHKPALTAEHAHLSYVVNIYDCISMNSLELLCLEVFFDNAQGLSRQKALFGSNNPHQLAFRLKGENLVHIQ